MTLLKFDSKVMLNKKISSSVNLIRFSIPNNFTFNPGQYISIVIQLDTGRIKRSYSLSSSPEKDFLEICVKNTGVGSNILCHSKTGDKFILIGPLGGFTIRSKNKDLVLISSGIGIAPYLSIIPYLLKKGFKKKVFLFAGFRYEEDIIYKKELTTLSKKYKNFSFNYILSQPKNRENNLVGHVQDFLEKIIPEKFNGDYYICGLSEMIEDTVKKLEMMNISKERIFCEKYD